jgi:hypothetical protein
MKQKPPFTLSEDHMFRSPADSRPSAIRKLLLEYMERRRVAGLMLPELQSLLVHTHPEVSKKYVSSTAHMGKPIGKRLRTKIVRLIRSQKQ